MPLRARIALCLEHFGFVRRRLTSESILEKTYQVVGGSTRTHDYDDAWILALGFDSRVVFDVGCNVGQSTLLLLHSASVEQVVLIDPNPAALAIAAENLIRNGLSPRARFVCAFASETAGANVILHTIGTGSAGSMYATHAKTASTLGQSIRVPTTSLDQLSQYFSLHPDLVKVDVEGAEHLVLKGATAVASRQTTRFLVEMHSSPELPMRDNAARIIDWCGDNGYRAWYLKEKCELSGEEMIASRGRCHLLLLPAAMPFPEYLIHLEQGAPLEKVRRPG